MVGKSCDQSYSVSSQAPCAFDSLLEASTTPRGWGGIGIVKVHPLVMFIDKKELILVSSPAFLSPFFCAVALPVRADLKPMSLH